MSEGFHRSTRQRSIIIELLTSLDRFVSAQELHAELKQKGHAIGLSTVYRNLETLENVGLVQHTHLGHGGATYHAAEELTHLHLVCGKCGSVGDAPIETAAPFVTTLVDEYGFKTDVTHFAIYGTCQNCSKS